MRWEVKGLGDPTSPPTVCLYVSTEDEAADARHMDSIVHGIEMPIQRFLSQAVPEQVGKGFRVLTVHHRTPEAAGGYDAYRDPQADRSEGGFQEMNNAVMWDADRWRLVDAGRVKLVEDDGSYYQGRAVVWDRFATWAMLQRDDGAIVSVVSSHMMTNPAKYPQQPGRARQSRVARYGAGMDVLVRTLDVLGSHGPVLMGGDMNSFPTQGPWTAAAKLTSAGFEYVRDNAVIYLFFDADVQVLDHRQVRVDSDHPALVTTLDMNGLGAS